MFKLNTNLGVGFFTCVFCICLYLCSSYWCIFVFLHLYVLLTLYLIFKLNTNLGVDFLICLFVYFFKFLYFDSSNCVCKSRLLMLVIQISQLSPATSPWMYLCFCGFLCICGFCNCQSWQLLGDICMFASFSVCVFVHFPILATLGRHL